MRKILLIIAILIALNPIKVLAQVNTFQGGTGLTSYTSGDIIYAGATNPIRFSKLNIGGEGTCLKVSSGFPSWGVCGAGGGSAGGTWSTTTSTVSGQLVNYSNNATDIVTIGSSATTSADVYMDANLADQKLHIRGTNNTGFVGMRITNASTNALASTSIIFGVTTNEVFNGAEIRHVRSPSNDLLFLNNGLVSGGFTGNGSFMSGTSTAEAQVEIYDTGSTVGLNVAAGASGVDIARFLRPSLSGVGIGITAAGGFPQIQYRSGTTSTVFSTLYESNIGTFRLATTAVTTVNNAGVEPFQVNRTSSQVGIGSSTPWGLLSVNPSYNPSNPSFVVGSSTRTDFVVRTSGFVGVGTSSPMSKFAVTGTTTLNGDFLVTRTGEKTTYSDDNLSVADFVSNTDNYSFVGIQNRSSGTNASSDLILANDRTTATTDYLDIGISSSLNNNPLYTGFIGYNSSTIAGGSYQISSDAGHSFAIGTTTSGADFNWLLGGYLTANEKMRLTQTGRLGIGSTTPGTILSVQGVANFHTATSTFSSTGGLNLVGGGCFAINGTCVGGGGAGVSGGTAGMLTSWVNSTTLTATGTPTAAAYYATSTTATSSFLGGVSIGDPTQTPGLVFSSSNGGWLGIGTSTPRSTLTIGSVNDGTASYGQMDTNAGAPAAGDCDSPLENGRFILDTTNNRLYVCNGTTRLWDYAALTD